MSAFEYAPASDAVGSAHFGDTVRARFVELVAILGGPNCEGDYHKVTTRWVLRFGGGYDAVTVYDWKETTEYDSVGVTPEDLRDADVGPFIDWHLGGFSAATTREAADALTALLEAHRAEHGAPSSATLERRRARRELAAALGVARKSGVSAESARALVEDVFR